VASIYDAKIVLESAQKSIADRERSSSEALGVKTNDLASLMQRVAALKEEVAVAEAEHSQLKQQQTAVSDAIRAINAVLDAPAPVPAPAAPAPVPAPAAPAPVPAPAAPVPAPAAPAAPASLGMDIADISDNDFDRLLPEAADNNHAAAAADNNHAAAAADNNHAAAAAGGGIKFSDMNERIPELERDL